MPFDREESLRRAEKLLRQGKLDPAIAEYRAVIEDQPSDWNTANALGDLYFRAGQIDRAVAEYTRIAEHLAGEGFLSKAAAIYKKILKIKPDEETAMWQLGSISERQGLLADARASFVTLIDRRSERGDLRGAAEARVRLGELEGADIEARLTGARARAALGETGKAVQRLKAYAGELREKGKDEDALRLLVEAASLDPADNELQRLLMQAFEARGDMAGARNLLASDAAGSNPMLLWALAETELRGGHLAEGIALLEKLLAEDPARRDTVVILGCTMAEVNPAAGFECMELAAKSAIADDQWAVAAEALNEFVSRVPGHVPALMRLVEISVDGGLESTMHAAQAQLADAYLAAGAGAEARVIAEDLVAREPWESANIDRFRRALTLLGETDIDTIIAERLSGQSPFTSTDVTWSRDTADMDMVETPVAAAAVAVPAARALEIPEVDLSEVLRDLRMNLTAALAEGDSAPAPAIEHALKGMRDEAVHDASPETAEQHFALAGTFMEMGMQEEAHKALEVSARSLTHRFRAGAALAKAFLDAGDAGRAIEWYERAADAPAPSPQAQHALLYDLASVLEANGEGARALAVLLELRAEAGDYRDLSARLEHLKVQMGS